MKQDRAMMETVSKAFKLDVPTSKPLRDTIEKWRGLGLMDKDIIDLIGLTKMEFMNAVDGVEHLIPSTYYRQKLAKVLLVEKVVKTFHR